MELPQLHDLAIHNDLARTQNLHELMLLHVSQEPRRNSGAIAFSCLRAFAQRQFRFFHNGVKNRALGVDSEGYHHGFVDFDPIYPVEYAMALTTEQVATDKDVLLRAISHRHTEIATPLMIQRLAKADIMAYQALKPAMRTAENPNGLINPTTVLTYFQKSPSIRIVPYAPIALVGLPLTPEGTPEQRMGTNRDLLAIPHEVGHHVYWRRIRAEGEERRVGDLWRSDLEQQLTGLPAWVHNWEEEIFADLFAVLIAGPVAALSLQEMMKAVPAHRSVFDDGHYPVPAVRPYIQLAALCAVAGQLSDPTQKQQVENVEKVLRKRWDDWNQNVRHIPMWFTPFGEHTPITLRYAETLLKSVVQATLDTTFSFLLPSAQSNFWNSWWSHGLDNTDQEITTLIVQFTEFVDNLDLNPTQLPELTRDEAAETVQLFIGDQPMGEATPLGMSGMDLEFEQLRDAALLHGKRPEVEEGDPPWWLPILRAAFWTTEGPEAADDQ